MNTSGIECPLKKRIPEGIYVGYWGGWDVVVNHDGGQWYIRTIDRIDAVNVPVSVVVTDDVISIVQVKDVEEAQNLVDVTFVK